MRRVEVPIWEKMCLTLQEASAYSGIGVNTIRNLAQNDGYAFTIKVGSKWLIKRKQFEEYIREKETIDTVRE